MTQDITTRQYKPKDKQGVIALFNEVFSSENPDYIPMTNKFWTWKYDQRPKPSEIIVVTTKDGNIIGQMGAQVDKIIYYGHHSLWYMTLDLCVIKDYRGQNNIQRIVYSLSDSDRITCGFPGGEYWGLYPRLFPGVQNFKLKIYSKKIKSTSESTNVTIQKTLSAKSSIDYLWNAKQVEVKIGTIRNWDYLKWAIIDHPINSQLFLITFDNDVVGYFAIRIQGDICSIVDILILNNYLDTNIILAIENECHKQGGHEIRIFTTDVTLQSTLTNSGFNYYREDQLVQGGFFNFRDKSNPCTLLEDIYLTWVNTDWDLYDKIRP